MNLEEVLLPKMKIAYVRGKGNYLETGRLWQRLLEWTNKNGISPPKNQFIGISYDEPEIGDDEKTYDACVVLNDQFPGIEDGINVRKIPGGQYLKYQFYDSVERLSLVYKEVVSEYLQHSMYDLDDRDFLEYVMNDKSKDPENKIRIDLYIPIKTRT